MKRSLVLLLALNCFVISGYGAPKTPLETIVAKARDKQGAIISASPKGENGTLTIEEAVKQLKPGSVLRLSAGRYQTGKKAWVKGVEIECDNVIVEGDGSGKVCEIDLVLLGKNCIVRNIWIYSVEAEGVTIIDSRLNPIICSSGTHSKSYIYNSLIHNLNLYPNNADVTVENCTLTRMYSPPRTKTQIWDLEHGNARKVGGYSGIISVGQLERKGNITINNSIIQTNGYLLNKRWSISPLVLTLTNNHIWCEQGYVVKNIDTDGRKNTVDTDQSARQRELKNLKGICRLRLKGKNLLEKTQFSKQLPPTSHHWIRALGTSFIPIDGTSAAKEKTGAYIGGLGLPVPRPKA